MIVKSFRMGLAGGMPIALEKALSALDEMSSRELEEAETLHEIKDEPFGPEPGKPYTHIIRKVVYSKKKPLHV